MTDTQGLFTVTQIDPIAVEFSLPQQMLPTLQGLINDPQRAPVKAYIGADTDGETGNLLGEGHLTLIDNQINANTGTIRAKAEFDNAGQKLWPGLLVTVKIQTALDKDALVVPPTVVQRGLDQHFVYRVKGDKVEAVPGADGLSRQRPGHHQRRQAGRCTGQRRPVAAQARRPPCKC